MRTGDRGQDKRRLGPVCPPGIAFLPGPVPTVNRLMRGSHRDGSRWPRTGGGHGRGARPGLGGHALHGEVCPEAAAP